MTKCGFEVLNIINCLNKSLISISIFWLTLILSSCSLSEINLKEENQSTIDLPIKNNLVLHLEANRGVAVEKNQVIGWIDDSPQGNNLVAVGDPNLIKQGLNGQATVHFDGEDDILENTFELEGLPEANSDRTVFMVAKYNSNGFGGFTYGKPDNNNVFGLVVDSEGYLAVQAWGQQNDKLTKVDGNGSGWLIQSAKLEAGILTQYKNGVQLNSTAHNYNTIPKKIVVGAEIDQEPHVDMEVAEIIIFNRALNETERQQVESYLQEKYFL